MDSLEQIFALLSFTNIILMLGITGIVWFLRKFIEMAVPKVVDFDEKNKYKTQLAKWWGEFCTPCLPILVGMALMLLTGMPIPEVFITSPSSKMIFGAGMGLLSGFVFRVIKKLFLIKLGKESEKSVYIEEPSYIEETPKKMEDVPKEVIQSTVEQAK